MQSNLTHVVKGDGKENFWELNHHLTLVSPFSKLYKEDKSKNKEVSSKIMWCVFWMKDPDEEYNKFYRIGEEERLDICKSFCKEFNPDKTIIADCLSRYESLCLDADEMAYKLQKDQLISLSRFLTEQPINLETVETLIKLKAQMPKIFQDFDKISKMYEKNKTEKRIYGGRKMTARERNIISPDE